MAHHNYIGSAGEQLAQNYLLKKGYAILDSNWRQGRYEVDIIAYFDATVIFVEVKTRSSVDYGAPETFVDLKKQRAYISLANRYMIEHHRDEEVRFDIISVLVNGAQCHIDHIENAFTPAEIK